MSVCVCYVACSPTVSSQVPRPSEYEPPLRVMLPPQAKVNRMPGARAVLLHTQQCHANAVAPADLETPSMSGSTLHGQGLSYYVVGCCAHLPLTPPRASVLCLAVTCRFGGRPSVRRRAHVQHAVAALRRYLYPTGITSGSPPPTGGPRKGHKPTEIVRVPRCVFRGAAADCARVWGVFPTGGPCSHSQRHPAWRLAVCNAVQSCACPCIRWVLTQPTERGRRRM